MIAEGRRFCKENVCINRRIISYGMDKRLFQEGNDVSGTRFVVVKMKELVKTAIFAVLGVVILVGLIYFFLHLGDDGGESAYRDGTYYADNEKMVDDLVKMLDSGMAMGVGHVNVDYDETKDK